MDERQQELCDRYEWYEPHQKWLRGEDGGIRADLHGANLHEANLRWANLSWANLSGANLSEVTMPGGERFEDWDKSIVPQLLVAGGKSIEEVMATGCWECNSWDNCPMRAAFDIAGFDQAPPIWRPRIEEFVQLFDAGLLKKPEVGAIA